MMQTSLTIMTVLCTSITLSTWEVSANGIEKLHMIDSLIQKTAGKSNNPALTAQCFAIYQPQLTAITNTYEKEYEICRNNAQIAKDAVDADVAANYTEVQTLSTNICGRFSKCSQDKSNSYVFFECNNKAVSPSVALSYRIQTISKDRILFIAEKNEIITFHLNTCSDKCSQKYITEYSRVFKQLQGCLNGEDQLETTPASTTITGTSEASTMEISTSTTTDTSVPTSTVAITTTSSTSSATSPASTTETSVATSPAGTTTRRSSTSFETSTSSTTESTSYTGFPTPPTIIDE